MVPLASLWLPILVAAAIVFLASWVIHVMLPYHKGDFKQVPNEDQVMDALRPFNIPPGEYSLPRCTSHQEMNSPEFQAKLERGPVMFLNVLPSGKPGMGTSLVQWFIYCVVVGIFAAYIAGRALGPGAGYLHVFRFAGATAFAGYGLALLQGSIWYRRAWSTTFKSLFDALVYACLTAGTLGWLWPGG